MANPVKESFHQKASSSLFVRCAALMTITTIVVASILSILSANLADNLVAQGVEAKAYSTLGQKAISLANPVKFNVANKIDAEVLDGLQTLGDSGLGLVVINANGDLISNPDMSNSALDELMAMASRAVETGILANSVSHQYLAQPIVSGKSNKVIGAVALAWSAAPAKAAIASQKLSIVGWASAVFGVMSVLTVYLLRRSLGRPMANISQAMRRVSEGDYDTPIEMTNRRDEIGGVARDLANLMEKLQSARENEADRERDRAIQITVVERLGTGLTQLADGVLHDEINDEFPGRYELLKQNFNRAIRGLNSVITDVNSNSANILDHADEIAQASQDLSRRTETQAATLEQSAAALDQMLAMVKDAATAADATETAVQTTSDLASKSGEVMRSAMNAMGEIEKSSDQINDIISVIDDIAFQTNLLALNAGVEAARAGETGKGFAVVASEVQGLAQRSAEAAQQIKELIDGSAEQVQDGVLLVQNAGSALDEVLHNVSSISTMVVGIAKRATDQAEGLNEINIGVTNLDRVTQQNAAMVEESTHSAQMLKKEAVGLSDLVEKFTLHESASQSGMAVPASDPSAQAA